MMAKFEAVFHGAMCLNRCALGKHVHDGLKPRVTISPPQSRAP